jgi:hypothetical protein
MAIRHPEGDVVRIIRVDIHGLFLAGGRNNIDIKTLGTVSVTGINRAYADRAVFARRTIHPIKITLKVSLGFRRLASPALVREDV